MKKPCYDCKERYPGCHGECEKYLEEKRKNEQRKREQNKQKERDAQVMGVLFGGRKK